MACSQGRSDTAAVLMQHGADVNFENRYGSTALTAAATMGNTIGINGLVGYGANIEYETCKGDTPLVLATKHGRVPAIITLLECGARIDGSNR